MDFKSEQYAIRCTCTQIDALEVELEEVHRRAAQFEEEAAEESQGVDLQLMDSQVGGTVM